jgi:hypothetical protein
MSKRLFQVFDEMNVNDDANKTAKLGCCYDMVDARTAKGGGHVTMGVPAEAITKIFLGEVQPILLLLDRKEYHRLNDQPVEKSEAEQQIEDTIEKITELMDFVAEAKGHISDEEIISQVRKSLPVFLETLTPKTTTNERRL